MDALELLLNRHSCAMLDFPGPGQKELDHILSAGLRAPDHAGLKPWRFITVSGEGLSRLSEIFAEAAESINVPPEKAKNMPFRAPLIIIGVTAYTPHPKVSETEQILSTGSALQLMQLAAMSLGYNGIWRTGPVADSKIVKAQLGLASNESITGFLYLGTPKQEGSPKQTPAIDKFVTTL